MLRANRGRLIGIILSLSVVYFLFISTSTSSDFRRRTEEGIARRRGAQRGVLRGDLSDEDLTKQTNQKLQEILANDARPTETGTNGQDVPVAGRKTITKGMDNQAYDSSPPKYSKDKSTDAEQKAIGTTEDGSVRKTKTKSTLTAKDIAREKLQEYLKKPVVIFSKSYCPHSKKAKHLLLDLYDIVPAPYVVELDNLEDPMPVPETPDTNQDVYSASTPTTLGRALQDLLGEVTGRRTVPNIMVGMHSIGGNDLIWDLHEKGELADKIKELAGKRIHSIDVKA